MLMFIKRLLLFLQSVRVNKELLDSAKEATNEQAKKAIETVRCCQVFLLSPLSFYLILFFLYYPSLSLFLFLPSSFLITVSFLISPFSLSSRSFSSLSLLFSLFFSFSYSFPSILLYTCSLSFFILLFSLYYFRQKRLDRSALS